jgi:hypothetical protein
MNHGSSDDLFLMFRCLIIQAGKEIYDKTLEKVDTFDFEIKHLHDKLISVADRAFLHKLGKDTFEELPSSICDGVEIYYDMGNN